jgi:hypothetical protein
MKQPTLWDNLRARTGDPSTSHEAMAAYDRDRMQNAVDWVISLYRSYGPMADFQLQERFMNTWEGKCCPHLYQQARSVARDRGHIVATEDRIVNPITKRKQIVWEYRAEACPVTIHKCPLCGKVTGRSVGG